MLKVSYNFSSGLMDKEKGNQIINEIIDSLRKHELTVEKALFILENVKQEINESTLIL